MKKLKIKILIGVPASGKSTWTKDFLRKNPDWVSVNRDYFRLMLRNEQLCTPKIEDLITDLVKKTIYASLGKKMNVIVDATHVKEKYITAISEEFKYFADIDYQIFDISLEKAIERDKNREMSVGEEVIKRMYKDYKNLMDSFHFQPVNKVSGKPQLKKVKYNKTLTDCVIFDIDGTLAEMNGKRGPFDYKNVYKDDVNEIVSELVKLYKEKGYTIIILTGRDEVCRQETTDWLDLYEIPHDEIHMRPKDDYRKDTVVKKEIYKQRILNRYNVVAVFDDRLQVLDMWYKEGIFTFNVNQGNIPF